MALPQILNKSDKELKDTMFYIREHSDTSPSGKEYWRVIASGRGTRWAARAWGEYGGHRQTQKITNFIGWDFTDRILMGEPIDPDKPSSGAWYFGFMTQKESDPIMQNKIDIFDCVIIADSHDQARSIFVSCFSILFDQNLSVLQNLMVYDNYEGQHFQYLERTIFTNMAHHIPTILIGNSVNFPEICYRVQTLSSLPAFVTGRLGADGMVARWYDPLIMEKVNK